MFCAHQRLKQFSLFQDLNNITEIVNSKMLLLFLFRSASCLFEEDILDFDTYFNNSSKLVSGEFGPLTDKLAAERHSNRNLSRIPGKSFTEPTISAKIEDISTVLDDQLNDFSSDVKKKIANSIESNGIDRSKYRDIFVIKKKIFEEGNKQVVKYDVDEKIIPKYPSIIYEMSTDKVTKFILIGIFVLLGTLVFTTTLKLYENLIKFKIFEKQTISNIKV